MTTDEYLQRRATEVDAALGELVRERRARVEPRLLEAMEYSLTSPGKRIRPILVLAAAEARRRRPSSAAFRSLVRLEMIHTYSLIHDDLPAMDDDDSPPRPPDQPQWCSARRSRSSPATRCSPRPSPSCSATAGAVPSAGVAAIVVELAAAAGPREWSADRRRISLAEGVEADPRRVESIHRRKTGALLRACRPLRRDRSPARTRGLSRALSAYGEALGLAFQIADDILDELGSTRGHRQVGAARRASAARRRTPRCSGSRGAARRAPRAAGARPRGARSLRLPAPSRCGRSRVASWSARCEGRLRATGAVKGSVKSCRVACSL